MTRDPRLQPGDPAPLFTLPDADGLPVSLADLRGQRVLLYAYPQAMTPGCTTQACDFRDNLAAFGGLGYTVIGLSPDPPEDLAAFRSAERLSFRLLSDSDHAVLEAYGAWGERSLYGRDVVGVIRSTFLIDADGLVEKAMYGVKATGHAARLLQELGADA